MKLIQQFFETLFLLNNDKGLDDEERLLRYRELYKDYLGEDNEFYHANDADRILLSMKERYGDELMQRVDILSEILYADATLTTNVEQKGMLLTKAFFFLNYLDENSGVYSLVRQGKIDEIQKEMDKISVSES